MLSSLPEPCCLPLSDGAVSLDGLTGQRMQACIDNRVMAQDIERLVRPFRDRDDGPDGFRGEFWGKWFTSLALAASYQPDAAMSAKLEVAVKALLDTQTEDGCIATYPYEEQHGMWDDWSRKYVLLGLIAHFEVTGDQGSLQGACRALDHLWTQVGPGRISLADCGHWAWKGLPPTSMLEPVARLYRLTGKETYKEIAEWIIGSWSRGSRHLPDGLKLIEHALAGAPAREVGNPKAYEQMSCFEGLCEMYFATGEETYRNAALALGKSIRETEITVVGSGSNHEMWCDTCRYETEVLEQPMETCATVTWMKLCYRLLQLTGSPEWADELECSLYNALAGSMTPDGSWWTYYSPLVGERVPSHFQYDDIGLSCCAASGPRGLLLTHRWAFMQAGQDVFVNLLEPGQARLNLADGKAVSLEVQSGYPVMGTIRIAVRAHEPVSFALHVRIPAWSKDNRVCLGKDEATPAGGTYHRMERVWNPGEIVEIHLDMTGRTVDASSGAPQVAVKRGPIVLALDNRLFQPDGPTVSLDRACDGSVDLKVRTEPGKTPFTLVAEAPFTYHKAHIEKEALQLPLCDYASAGNAFSSDNVFRTWLPQPLFLSQAYVTGTRRLQYPDG